MTTSQHVTRLFNFELLVQTFGSLACCFLLVRIFRLSDLLIFIGQNLSSLWSADCYWSESFVPLICWLLLVRIFRHSDLLIVIGQNLSSLWSADCYWSESFVPLICWLLLVRIFRPSDLPVVIGQHLSSLRSSGCYWSEYIVPLICYLLCCLHSYKHSHRLIFPKLDYYQNLHSLWLLVTPGDLIP